MYGSIGQLFFYLYKKRCFVHRIIRQRISAARVQKNVQSINIASQVLPSREEKNSLYPNQHTAKKKKNHVSLKKYATKEPTSSIDSKRMVVSLAVILSVTTLVCAQYNSSKTRRGAENRREPAVHLVHKG